VTDLSQGRPRRTLLRRPEPYRPRHPRGHRPAQRPCQTLDLGQTRTAHEKPQTPLHVRPLRNAAIGPDPREKSRPTAPRNQALDSGGGADAALCDAGAGLGKPEPPTGPLLMRRREEMSGNQSQVSYQVRDDRRRPPRSGSRETSTGDPGVPRLHLLHQSGSEVDHMTGQAVGQGRRDANAENFWWR
jgi:hypothetical protein